MAEDAKAATQYGDIKGTIAADGFDGIRITDLYLRAEVPKGYQPIGLRINGLRRHKSGDLKIRASVLCVDTDQTGQTPDDIKNFGRENGNELHTFKFDAEIEVEAILRLIKRLDIVLTGKVARGIDVKIQPIDD